MSNPLKAILQTCLNIKNGEKVLIIADKNTENIAHKILHEAVKITNSSLKMIPIGKHNGDEPPTNIAKEMLHYDVIIAPTTTSLTHTKAVLNAKKNNARVATMPGITEKIMNGSLLADYKKIERFTKNVLEKLNDSVKIKVTTTAGSDFSFSVNGRNWLPDTGIISKKGTCTNLPAGEVFVSPLEGSFNGKIVLDIFKHEGETYAARGSLIEVKNGKVVSCSDKPSKVNSYFKNIKNADNIAEFGIGTNYKAKIIGNILQDEKVLGTCHVAFGNNSSIGGKVYSKLHLDTVLQKPTIIVDDVVLMKGGKFLL